MTETVEVQACNFTNGAIERYARRVGEHYEIYDSTRADLDRLVQRLNGQITADSANESLVVNHDYSFTIHVPSFVPERRNRFTVAHEMGHYFLHLLYPDMKPPQKFFRGGSNRVEFEANMFAGALLMPENEFLAEYNQLDGDEWKLAAAFDVSREAVRVRAQVLKLVDL